MTKKSGRAIGVDFCLTKQISWGQEFFTEFLFKLLWKSSLQNYHFYV